MSGSAEVEEATDVARPKRRWGRVIVIAVVLFVIVGGGAWVIHAANRYRQEQRALKDFGALFDDGAVRVELVASDPEETVASRDATAVVSLAWSGADWLRGPMEAMGQPILMRVKAVTIYDARIDDRVVEPLSGFYAMEQLTLAGGMGISRDGLREIRNAAPNVTIWIEHDDERFQTQGEDEAGPTDDQSDDAPAGEERLD